MVLILSKSKNELSTDEVIDWIHYLGGTFYRLNGEDLLNSPVSVTCGKQMTALIPANIQAKFQEAKTIWYRRWFEAENIRHFEEIDPRIAVRYIRHIKGEAGILSHFLFAETESEKWVDHPSYTNISKLDVLEVAEKIGLNIPSTLITNQRSDVEKMLQLHSEVITKPISEALFLDYKKYSFLTHTRTINSENIHLLPETFFPSLFQQNIQKKYEIRAFILGDQIYSMAIFSQNDPQTQADFRNYNNKKPNRFVPYKLPEDIEKLLLQLMSVFQLKSGSLDLIFSKIDSKIYFLEINPNGQFSMVSKPCNYNLEKKFAEYLISHQKNG